jgi:hypothetical protein
VTKKLLDRVVACDGFATALLDERVGWLEEDENGNLRLPNFDRHNGKGAKKRATDAERQANKRAKDVKQNVPDMSRKERDNNVTREEKRREDLKDITPITPKGRSLKNHIRILSNSMLKPGRNGKPTAGKTGSRHMHQLNGARELRLLS